jgi:lysophospholipase L1-like esterase
MIKHPHLIRVLLITILTLLTIEVFLTLFDPLGAKAYFDDLAQLYRHMRYDAHRDYVLAPGDYHFSHWQAHIYADTTRRVPNTRLTSCRLAMVGDSVTFGHGVNDKDTWVNLIAKAMPDTTFLNAGVNGYNIEQVYKTISYNHADGYFYLLIPNDADPTINWQAAPPLRSTLSLYLFVLSNQHAQNNTNRDKGRFNAIWALIHTKTHVVTVGLNGDPLAGLAGVPTVDFWTHANSMADGHANAQGNQELAAELLPYVRSLRSAVC